MPNTHFSNYGKALFELIGDKPKELEKYQKALADVKDDLAENPELLSFLSSYALSKESQFSLIEKIYGEKGLKHLVPFLKLLADRRLFPKFGEIEASFHTTVNQALGREEGIVYSASALQKEEIHSLEEILTKRLNKQVELSNRVEPSLLGGVRVFVGGRVFDGSIETKVESLRKILLNVAKGGSGV